MNQYKIYENQLGLREAVKQGWSWTGFFFSWIWAFIKKMNVIGGATLGGIIFLSIISAAVTDAVGEDNAGTLDAVLGLAYLAVPVVFGVNGNAWREKNLLSRAYEFKITVSAESDEAAIATYLKQTQQKPQTTVQP